MVFRGWCSLGLVLATLGACGGTTASTPADGGVADAAESGGPTDAGTDAAYLACMTSTGQLLGIVKSCMSSSDCVIEQELTDCCGTTLYVGISMASVGAFNACESAWEAHFPGCGCASNQTGTEDGIMARRGDDAPAPQVHCIDFTMNGGVCMTYTP